jgi:hypothetical protein
VQRAAMREFGDECEWCGIGGHCELDARWFIHRREIPRFARNDGCFNDRELNEIKNQKSMAR